MAKSTTELAAYADKPVNDHNQFYADWIASKTGVDVDPQSVFLAIVLHGKFQSSPENRDRNAKRKAERAASLKAKAEKASAAKAPVKKSSAPAAKKAAAAPAKKAASKPVAKKTTVKKAATKPTGEAPF